MNLKSFFLIILNPISNFADLKDYHFSPFSQMQKLVFVEDFYNLYLYEGLNASSLSLVNKIIFLEKTIELAKKDEWWAHPTRSLAYPHLNWSNKLVISQDYTEIHHKKYKLLLQMNLHFFLVKEFIALASLYDRPNIYWFHKENYSSYSFKKKYWKTEHYLKKSFEIAKNYYLKAEQHWQKCFDFAKKSLNDFYFNKDTQATIYYKNIHFQNDLMHQLENKAFEIFYQNDTEYKKEKLHYHPEAFPKYNYGLMIKKFLENLNLKEKKLDEIIE